MARRVVYLTTEDNPYDPNEEFEDWYNFDTSKGYNSCAYLARIARTSDELPDNLNLIEIEQAIDEICRLNLSGKHKKLVKFI